MPKRPSSAAIGIFVIGSIALAIVALAVLGSGNLFRKPHRFICFFQGSLNGLRVGAAVKVRGVQIGEVAEIRVSLPPSEGRLKSRAGALGGLPVLIDVDESQLVARGGTGKNLTAEALDRLIDRGLRAQLATESLLTGLLYVEVDLHPGTPINLMLVPGSSSYLEIPTIPTDLEQVQEAAMRALGKLDKVDFVKLTQSFTDAAVAATNLINSRNIRETLISTQKVIKNVNTAVNSIDELARGLNRQTGPVLTSFRKASDQANLTLEQATLALIQMKSTAAELHSTLSPDAPLIYRLDVALRDFSEATNAIRELTEFLQRNPSAIIRGKYQAESRP